MAVHRGFSFPTLMDYFQKKAFQEDNSMKGTDHRNNSHLQDRWLSNSHNGGILGKVAWKCIFIVTNMKSWGFCLGKTNWHQVKDNTEMSLGRVHTWQLLQGLVFVFILPFFLPRCLCFYCGDITPRVQAELHNSWLFWDSVLRIHCQLSPVAWDWFLLNTPPFHWRMGGMRW